MEVANGSRVFARFGDALHDGAGIILAKGKKFENRARIGFSIQRTEAFFLAGHDDQGIPV